MASAPAGAASVELGALLGAGARALVNAQVALDAHAAGGDGGAVPRTAFAYTHCRIRLPVRLACAPRAIFAGRSALSLAPANASLGGISVQLRLVSRRAAPEAEAHGEER